MFKTNSMKYSILFFILLFGSFLNAQEFLSKPSDFLEKYTDYAYAVYQDYWLVAGGRVVADDQVEVLSSFNASLMVFDWKKDTVISLSVSEFPIAIKEQLASTGMSFLKVENKLFLVGGYGYRSAEKACSTIPSLLILEISEIIYAILEKNDPLPYIKQTHDPRFALRDSQLYKADGFFFLVGGEKAYLGQGRTDDRLYFLEDCKDQIQGFKVELINEKLEIFFLQEWKDFGRISETLLLLF